MSQPAVKRACDACHRRKVKCDGISPCRNCNQAQLSCTYNAVPQKKGPKGSRAKVISELRETQRQTSLAAKIQSRLHGAASSLSTTAPTPGLLTPELIKPCLDFYFDNLYAQMPILDRRTIDSQMSVPETQHDTYTMVAALCAFVLLQPGMNMPAIDFQIDSMAGANIQASLLLVEEAQRVRGGLERLDKVSLNAVATDFFLFGCSYAHEAHDRAWYHLREATTMVEIAGMNKEEHYLQLGPVESSRRRRLFWLLYATERAYAIDRNRPLTLQATINLPDMNDDPSDPLAHELHSFITLANLFKPFDHSFINIWNKTRASMSNQHIGSLREQLNEHVQSWLGQDTSFADQHTNQPWLESLVWQFTNGPGHNDDSSPYQQFNSNMSRDVLLKIASQFPQGMHVLESGLIEKLMETTLAMIKLLAMQPEPQTIFAPNPRERMSSLLHVVAMSRIGDHTFAPVLMPTVAETLPKLVNPMLQNAPENTDMMGGADMFDGWSQAGMPQLPPQQMMPMDDFDRKVSVEEYDKQYMTTPDSQANSAGSNYGFSSQQQQQQQPQGQDVNAFAVSSPGIMSPGMEFAPQQMAAFASTPISEMVPSPMGYPSQQNPMNAHQGQQPHMPGHSHEGMAQHHMQSMTQQHVPTSQPMNKFAMPPQQQQQPFHLQGPPQMRTLSNFPPMQRDARQSIVGMGSMSHEIDFGNLQ